MTQRLMPPVEKPPHVPDDRVCDFDVYNLPGWEHDVQLALRAFQQSQPDFFWSPYNGGHWTATRAADIELIQRNPQRYSSRSIAIPKLPDNPRAVPIEYDPPIHAKFRIPLTIALGPKRVGALDQPVRELAISRIESFIGRGHCEFLDEFGRVLPLSIFLDLVDLPRDDLNMLARLADEHVRGRTIEIKQAAIEGLFAYLAPFIHERMANPRNDLISMIGQIEVAGERITFEQALSYASVVMGGGLDTVASMMGFFAAHLAVNEPHRRQIAANLDNPTFLDHAIEEMMRRHGVINTCRVVTEDHELNGVAFKADDVILTPNALYGLDDRQIADPEKIDFDRPGPIRHATFNFGPHVCPGASLARRELRIFLEEWLKRIPDFWIKEGTSPVLEAGMVNGISRLELAWPVGNA